MKANELRIGNLIQHNKGNNFFVNPNHLIVMMMDVSHNYNPIPLTEEWLFKFGFEIGYNQKKMLDVYCKDFGLLIERSNGGNFYYKKVFIQYVHQLQNLYFALTGEELVLKE